MFKCPQSHKKHSRFCFSLAAIAVLSICINTPRNALAIDLPDSIGNNTFFSTDDSLAGGINGCGPIEAIDVAPFMISNLEKNFEDQTGTGRITTSFLKKNAKNVFIAKALPVYSIVRLRGAGGREKLMRDFNAKSENEDVTVEVVSLPNERSNKELKHAKRAAIRSAVPSSDKMYPEVGDVGRVRKSALEGTEGFLFKVTEEAVFKEYPGLEPLLKNHSLKYAMKDSKYLARQCCEPSGDSKKTKVCKYEYEFQVVDSAHPEKIIKSFVENMDCDLTSALIPFTKEQMQAMEQIVQMGKSNFDDIQQFDGRFVKIPLLENPPENSPIPKLPEISYCPNGACVHYHGTKPGDPDNNDAFAHPISQCAFMKAVEDFKSACEYKFCSGHCANNDCIVNFGDFYHSKKWNWVDENNKQHGHAEHLTGQCVDLRPMAVEQTFTPQRWRNCSVNKEAKTTKCKLDENYDRGKTQLLVDTLIKHGGVGRATDDGLTAVLTRKGRKVFDSNGEELPMPIYFNDVKGIYGVEQRESHNDHLHVCFPYSEPTVVHSCQSGAR